MPTDTLDLSELAADYAAAQPPLDPSQQRIALTTYRLLAAGRPISTTAIAEHVGLPLAEVRAYLDRPTRQRDEHGRIVGFGGLTLNPTAHALDLDGRTLYTWCALDALFLPELLGEPGHVRSVCPQTGETISLRVDATGVQELAPPGAVMSMRDADKFDWHDVIASFCCFVHFFASKHAARTWTTGREGTYVVPIRWGHQFARHYNHRRFGAAATSPSPISTAT